MGGGESRHVVLTAVVVLGSLIGGCGVAAQESIVAGWSGSIDETFEERLTHIRSGECDGLWTVVGSCNGWDVLAESSGYGATWEFYDSHTGLPVAQRSMTDVADERWYAPGADKFYDCLLGVSEFLEVEQIVCWP